jgi:hypothetical protein
VDPSVPVVDPIVNSTENENGPEDTPSDNQENKTSEAQVD